MLTALLLHVKDVFYSLFLYLLILQEIEFNKLIKTVGHHAHIFEI